MRMSITIQPHTFCCMSAPSRSSLHLSLPLRDIRSEKIATISLRVGVEIIFIKHRFTAPPTGRPREGTIYYCDLNGRGIIW